EAVFNSETASGWQEVSFASPVPVTANTTYVISYHSNNGFYSLNSPFFNTRAVVDEPLTGLQSGTDGSNGVYRYSNTPTFPNLTYQSSNYWVDVVFNTLEQNALPNITLISPEDGSTFTTPAAVTLEATASDPDGTITKVEFFRDNLKIGEDLSHPYSFIWNHSSTGNYSLTAEATDNSGAKRISSTVNIVLTAPAGNIPPTVSAGEDQILVLPEDNITLSASASDSDGSIISYLWEQLGGPAAEIQNAASMNLELLGLEQGVYVFRVTVADNEGGTASDDVSIIVNALDEFNCPCTVFEDSEIPTGSLKNDGIGGLQLGMKFQSQVDGYITGAKFYKQSGNSGVHTGQLYNSNGNLLAEAVFQNETSSGWQQVKFDFPVAVTANTTYIISYHTSAGFYSLNEAFYSGAVLNEPLQALRDGSDGGNGVYRYTSTPEFPNFSYNMSNYWVDAIFETTASATVSKNVLSSPDYSKPSMLESALLDRIEVIPNPFSDYATLVYQLQEGGFYSISIYDARGSLVRRVKEIDFAVAGEEYTLEIDATSLPQGIYFLRISHQNEVKATQLVINK
ncbi:DUF4082 domain-containing protein, partial [Salinimicrobium sp. GXAS 041]|uniref:DUF4082 domain-containing protein n=1 Tax=Salinimicrobium sp. GXAS 041 TaxID=3400806 RepID=UPI003C744E88